MPFGLIKVLEIYIFSCDTPINLRMINYGTQHTRYRMWAYVGVCGTGVNIIFDDFNICSGCSTCDPHPSMGRRVKCWHIYEFDSGIEWQECWWWLWSEERERNYGSRQRIWIIHHHERLRFNSISLSVSRTRPKRLQINLNISPFKVAQAFGSNYRMEWAHQYHQFTLFSLQLLPIKLPRNADEIFNFICKISTMRAI